MPDNQHGLQITGVSTATAPVTTEYDEFMEWWPEYAKTLNMRATLVWQELAWAGWFARSEKAEGKIPSVFEPRKGSE